MITDSVEVNGTEKADEFTQIDDDAELTEKISYVMEEYKLKSPYDKALLLDYKAECFLLKKDYGNAVGTDNDYMKTTYRYLNNLYARWSFMRELHFYYKHNKILRFAQDDVGQTSFCIASLYFSSHFVFSL